MVKLGVKFIYIVYLSNETMYIFCIHANSFIVYTCIKKNIQLLVLTDQKSVIVTVALVSS